MAGAPANGGPAIVRTAVGQEVPAELYTLPRIWKQVGLTGYLHESLELSSCWVASAHMRFTDCRSACSVTQTHLRCPPCCIWLFLTKRCAPVPLPPALSRKTFCPASR